MHSLRYVIRCALRELVRRKTRTAGTIAGYSIAVAAGIVLSLMLFSARDASDQILRHTGTHFMALMTGCGMRDCGVRMLNAYDGFEVNGIQALPLSAGVAEKIKKLPSVKDASLLLAFRFYDTASQASLTIAGFDPLNSSAVGTTCCASGDVLQGRFLTNEDSIAVLAHEAYAALRHISVGDTVSVAGRNCMIAGIINPGIRPARADIYLNLFFAQRLVQTRLLAPSMTGQGNAILVETESSLLHDEALRELKKEGFITSTYKCYQPAATVVGMNKKAVVALLFIIALITILFAVKTQISSVIERRREIAVLRTIGWSSISIVHLLITESCIQAVCGCVLGCVSALMCMAILPDNGLVSGGGFAYVIISAAFVFACCGGIVAGIVPALYAVALKPSEALRRL